jgi:hypothetical protein
LDQGVKKLSSDPKLIGKSAVKNVILNQLLLKMLSTMLKRIIAVLLITGAVYSTKAQTIAENKPVVETAVLKEKSFDFGKIPQGRPVTHVFQLVNKSTSPIVLENVLASCGCTTPEWSREPVPPGATTTIKVGYNAAAEGPFNKNVTIQVAGGPVETIVISGNVYRTPATSAPLNSSLTLLKNK